MKNKPIALLTDFGIKDNFVGVMKGVMLDIAPGVQFIDITHQVRPQNIREGAFLLKASVNYFPKGTVFLVVVDPGVGSERKPIAVKTENYFFVAPDNGVLSPVLENEKVETIMHLNNSRYFLDDFSFTFHGRDIFAPAAAFISQGTALEKMGTEISKIKTIDFSGVKKEKQSLQGEIIFIDRFGNLVTNIRKKELLDFSGKKGFKAAVKNREIKRLYAFYGEAEEEELFFCEGGFGFLEISLKNDNAQELLSAAIGEKVKLEVAGND